jgi:DNA repair exonuclease SbcCD ATPase subunit
MKSIHYLIIVVFSVVAFSCNQTEKKEIARLSLENQSLKQEAQAKDSSINGIMQSLNDIEGNLAEIKEKEAVIAVKSGGNQDMTPDVRAKINDDVKIINELMSKNKKEIGWLRKKLKDSNLKVSEIEKMVDELNIQIGERDTQITALKDDLSKMNFSVTSLNASLDTMRVEQAQMKSTIQDRTAALNTAYYVTGNKKELIADNVIAKEGGVVGINTSTKLKSDFNNSKFRKIDITQLKDIELNSKKVKLVTTHPVGSYQLSPNKDGVIEKLEITNPDRFWSTSKYLVVLVN